MKLLKLGKVSLAYKISKDLIANTATPMDIYNLLKHAEQQLTQSIKYRDVITNTNTPVKITYSSDENEIKITAEHQ